MPNAGVLCQTAKVGRGSYWLIEKSLLECLFKSRNIQTFLYYFFLSGLAALFSMGEEELDWEDLCLRDSETGDLSVSFVFARH